MVDLRFPWILAVPLLAGLALLLLPRRRPRGVAMGFEGSADHGTRRWRVWAGLIPRGARVGVVITLSWVAASPMRTVPIPPEPGEGVALVVALDVSESMGEPGLGGRQKLDVARDEIRRFVEGREGDALGLVTFGGEAVVRVPPTVDRGTLLDALGGVKAGELGDGTAVGTALGMAANRLRGMDARSRVVVLVSDGRNNAGALDPVTAARAAAALGQRVYVVEVGGGETSEAGLAYVAEAGHGRHFLVTDEEGLDAAYGEIGALEPSRLPGRPTTAQVPAAGGLLWVAAGLLAVERVLRASRVGRLP